MDNKLKEKYEEQIRKTKLFSIDKDASPSAYEVERYKLLEAIYNYYISINKERYEDYAQEIMEGAVACISSFAPEKGDFVHILNMAVNQRVDEGLGREIFAQNHGGKKRTRIVEAVRKYLIRTYGTTWYDVPLTNYCEVVAEALNSTKETIVDAVEALLEQFQSEEVSAGDEGGMLDFLENMADTKDDYARLEDKEAVAVILDRIDSTYLSLQLRQQPLVSELMTAKILGKVPELADTILEYRFASVESIERFKKTGYLLSQKEIGEMFNRGEQSISRTYSEFASKLGLNI